MLLSNNEELQEFYERVELEDFFIHLIPTDNSFHFKLTQIAAIYVYIFSSGEEYIIPCNHVDSALEFNTEEFFRRISKDQQKYCVNKKNFLYIYKLTNLIDLNLAYYFLYNKSIDFTNLETSAHKHLKSLYYNIKNINALVPILKHLELCQNLKSICLKFFKKTTELVRTPDFKYYNEILIPTLFEIEKNGLKIDPDLMDYHFPLKRKKLTKDDLIYSEYNIYTSTGRPSNRFGGINFAALNKETGVREIFKSRYENGVLIEFDYNAYHLKIIANLIGYVFPTDINIHDYLGKYYFQKETLTDEEHEESKKLSFSLLYGGIDSVFQEIPFFGKTNDYINTLWSQLNKNGYIESPISKKKIFKENIEDINKYKFWNYLIQLLETETSVSNLQVVLDKIRNSEIKLILYTYDSFLFDVPMNEAQQAAHELKTMLECNEKFNVSVKVGKNYNELKKINI